MPDTNTTPGNTKPNTAPPGSQGAPGGAQGGASGNTKPNPQGTSGTSTGLGGGRGGGGGGATHRRDNAAPGNQPPAPKCPKFWEQEPVAWFMVFRGHYEGRNLGQLDLFKALLPLLPALAVSLCRPLVTSPTPTVMDDAQRLLLAHYELGPLERGRALVHCTSLGDRTPREMLQYMRSLQPGEQEGVMFRYVFVSLLSDVVREVVPSIDSLDGMASTAGSILQANAASSPRVASVLLDREAVAPVVAAASRRLPTPSVSPAPRLCRLHATNMARTPSVVTGPHRVP